MQAEGRNDGNFDKKKVEVTKANGSNGCCAPNIVKDKVQAPVFMAVVLFSMSTWISITSIFVEMPLLVDFLPEAWSLPSYLVIIIQCSNIGPVIYAIVQKMKFGGDKKRFVPLAIPWFRDIEVVSVFVIMSVCVVSTLMLSLFWVVTVQLGDTLHSIPLFVLVSICALVSCTSSVVFLPYMARFKTCYISAFYIGNGLCGMVPGMLGLVQGIGQEPDCIFHNDTTLNGTTNVSSVALEVKYKQPLFSVSVFFSLITVLIIFCIVAFCFLNFASLCRDEMVASHENGKTEDVTSEKVEHTATNKMSAVPFLAESSGSPEKTAETEILPISNTRGESKRSKSFLKRHGKLFLLLTYVGILNGFTNSLIPASLSYTCLPYGRITYTLSVRLSSVAVPVASLSTLFFPETSLILIHSLMLIAFTIAVFLLVLAGHSPELLFEDFLTGQILIVSV